MVAKATPIIKKGPAFFRILANRETRCLSAPHSLTTAAKPMEVIIVSKTFACFMDAENALKVPVKSPASKIIIMPAAKSSVLGSLRFAIK